MKKLLIGYVANIKGSGLDNYIFHVIDALKDEPIEIGILTSNLSSDFKEKMDRNHIRVHEIARLIYPSLREGQIQEIIETEGYDGCYFNISESFDNLGNTAAKKAKNHPVVITHSHSSGNDNPNPFKRFARKMIHLKSRKQLIRNTDYFFSCSKPASTWMYGKDHPYRLIRNCIDEDRFKYSPEKRLELRKELNLEGKYVIGFVGGLNYQKNVFYLPFLLEQAKRITPEVHLLIFGQGDLREDLEKEFQNSNLSKYVTFMGAVGNVNDYYNAMDLFVLPSNFEGLPLVGIEAQVNGLPCLFSNRITSETAIGPGCYFIDTACRSVDEEVLKMAMETKRHSIDELDGKELYSLDAQKQTFIDIFINDEY